MLVVLDNLCMPKLVGGLGLRDPKLLKKALGVKLWLKWL